MVLVHDVHWKCRVFFPKRKMWSENANQNWLSNSRTWMPMMQTASCSTPCKFLSPRLLSYMLCAAAELPCYLLSKCNFCSLITQYYIHKSLVELLTFNSNANLSVCETVDELAPDRISSAGRSGLSNSVKGICTGRSSLRSASSASMLIGGWAHSVLPSHASPQLAVHLYP